MNYREDLEIQLQKVNLAIQEVFEDLYITDKEKQERIEKLINFKEAIIYKGKELRIDLEAAQTFLSRKKIFKTLFLPTIKVE